MSNQSHEALGHSSSGQASAGGGGYGPPPGGYGPPPGPPPGGYGAPPGGYGAPPPGGGFGPPPGGYGPPPGFGGGFPPGYGPGGSAEAEGKVKAPAIIMIICSAIGILLQLASVLMNLIGTGMGAANAEYPQLASGAVGILFNIIAIFVGSFCIFGLMKMMKLEGRSLSYTAVILSMIPCFGSCWCINLFVGIWALVVLGDQQVKESFRS